MSKVYFYDSLLGSVVKEYYNEYSNMYLIDIFTLYGSIHTIRDFRIEQHYTGGYNIK